ncbi:MAG: hypothetical protein MUC87_14750 [Bacteroidia bacterium]|jgi:hypothetical protein|nr:hypothetical protein [Bacteroidia bacterium]
MATGIQIPEPCHESWQGMTPQENGRFCDSCCKVVVDFTRMSNDEISAYLQSRKNEKVCGRFTKTQVVAAPAKPAKLVHIKWQLQKFAAALWLVFGALLFTACHTPNAKEAKQEKKHSPLLGELIINTDSTTQTKTTQKPTNKSASPQCENVQEIEYISGAPAQIIGETETLMGDPIEVPVVEVVKGEILAPDTLIPKDTLKQTPPNVIEHEMGKVQYVAPKKKKRK